MLIDMIETWAMWNKYEIALYKREITWYKRGVTFCKHWVNWPKREATWHTHKVAWYKCEVTWYKRGILALGSLLLGIWLCTCYPLPRSGQSALLFSEINDKNYAVLTCRLFRGVLETNASASKHENCFPTLWEWNKMPARYALHGPRIGLL